MIARVLSNLLITALAGAWISGPTVTVSVKDNDVVSDVTKVTAQAFSEAGVTKVEFSVDDQLRATLTKAPYEYKWDTIDEDEGRHTLIVAVFDGEGKTGTKRVKVEVDNGLSKGVKPHAEMAQALFRKGELDAAMLEARKAYRVNNADIDAIRALAAATGGKGDYNRAIDLLEKQQNINNQLIGDAKSYPLSDKSSMELRGLFRMLRAEKQPNAAAMLPDLTTSYDFWRKLYVNYLTDVRSAHPDTDQSAAGLFAVGDALYYHGEYDAALALYQKAPTGGKDGVYAAHRSALAMIRLGRLKDAELLLTSLISAGKGTDVTHAILGDIALIQRRYAKARSEMDGPVSHSSLSGLVIASHADVGKANYRQALDELKQAAAKASDFAEVQYLAAGLFTDTRDLARASSSLFAAMRADPGLLDFYAMRGFQLASLVPTDGFAQAQVFFDFVLQREPHHHAAMIGKAMCLVNQKKYAQAEPLLKELTREDRDSADVWIVQAAVLASGTVQQGASEALATARKLDPEHFNYIYVPKMAEIASRVATYRRPPLLTPALIALEETGK
jgi:tetratricopeptide (TPR) repeat protein